MNAVLRRRRLFGVVGAVFCGGWLLGAALLTTGCGQDHPGPPQAPGDTLIEPERVVVQHLLVGFQDSVPGRKIERSRLAAHGLAATLYEEARRGGDFDALVRLHTDDNYPGIYGMSNLGVPPNREADPPEYPRSSMIPAFGNVGFQLRIGEYGLAEYDPKDSPYGWHILKRLR